MLRCNDSIKSIIPKNTFHSVGSTHEKNNIKLITSNDNVDIRDLSRRDGFETQNANKIFESTYIGKEAQIKNNGESSYEKSCQKIHVFLQKYQPS